MKRAEHIAWAALAGLVTIFVILLIGGIRDQVTAWWAGAMLAGGQAVVVGLAVWGLRLARQAAELREAPDMPVRKAQAQPAAGFRMSVGDDAGSSRRGQSETPTGAETLDTGFQRICTGAAGVILVGLAAYAIWLIASVYIWAGKNPEISVPITGLLPENVDKYTPRYLDDLGLLIGLAAAAIYGTIYWIARPKRRIDDYNEAVYGVMTMGLGAMLALGVGTLLAWFKVGYASEVAAGVIAFFMLLEGLELIINACRSYSSIEELDQEAVDLHAIPLLPMLSSLWLGGLRMLVAQSVGLSGEAKHERGVMSRMMPRVLVATVVIAIGASCLRVVPPGEVAVLERLGYTPTSANGQPLAEAMLQPGLHVTMPWPIDKLTPIPTDTLQTTNVGSELHTPKNWKGIDFQFWMVRDQAEDPNNIEDLFLTGDPGAPQILETYVTVQWRVTDPAAFYAMLSHSEMVQRKEGEEATVSAIYEAIVQQCTSYAVTRAFAIHSLEQIMLTDRHEVEDHCRELLQKKLDSLGAPWGLKHSGITINYLTIKDLHPPYGHPNRPNDPDAPAIGGIAVPTPGGMRIDLDPNGGSKVGRGPASAFEFVISMREFKEQMIALARGEVAAQLNDAKGYAESELKKAETYKLDTVARAQGAANRLQEIVRRSDDPASPDFITLDEQKRQIRVLKQRMLYHTMEEIFDPVTKIIVDKDARDVQIYQNTANGPAPLMPR